MGTSGYDRFNTTSIRVWMLLVSNSKPVGITTTFGWIRGAGSGQSAWGVDCWLAGAGRQSNCTFTHPTHLPGVNGLAAAAMAAMAPPPRLFTLGAFGNPNNPFTFFPVPVTRNEDRYFYYGHWHFILPFRNLVLKAKKTNNILYIQYVHIPGFENDTG